MAYHRNSPSSATAAPLVGVAAREAISSFGVWKGRNLFVEWSAVWLLERLGARPVLVPPGATDALQRLAGLVLVCRDSHTGAVDADRAPRVNAELMRCAIERGIPLLVLSDRSFADPDDRSLAKALVDTARGDEPLLL